MRVCEWVAVAYFGYLCVTAFVRPAWPRRWPAAIVSVALMVAAFAPSLLPPSPLASAVRDWIPAAFLVAGYWLSGWFFVAPNLAMEAKFLRWDRTWLGPEGGARIVDSLPRWALEVLEAAYSGCFLFVPGSFILLLATGHGQIADRFWTVVLLAEYGSFGVLPWIQTRPPRALEAPSAMDRRGLRLRALNRAQNSVLSIGVNTFPSGHVAGSLATALVVSETMPVHAPWLMATVLLISASAVLGRYHYLVDAVAGALVALAAWVLTRGLF